MRIPGAAFIGSFYRNHRRLALLAVVGGVVALAVFTVGLTRRNPVQYFTADVEQGDIQAIVNATGTINAVTTVQVGSQVSGMISELYVDFNSQVHRGQVIARIDPSIFQTRVLQAEADLASADAGVKSLDADLISAQANQERTAAALREAGLNLKRTGELFEQGITSVQQKESAEVAQETAAANHRAAAANISQIRARLDQARATVKQRRAQLEQAKLDLAHSIIKAPIDGTVIARNVDVGQTVAASLQAPTLFTIAQDLTQMLVYAKTDESDVGKIQVGATANFKVDSFPNETFRGRVTQVRMNAYQVQNVVTYDTIIEFDNPDRKLLPGMTAYVTIPVAHAREVVKIPNGALRYVPDMAEAERQAVLQKYNLLGPPPAEAAQERGGPGTVQAQERQQGEESKDGPAKAQPGRERAGGGGAEGRGQGQDQGRWGNMSDEERAKMRERFQNMSPEERAKMRQTFMQQRQAQEQQQASGPYVPRSGPEAAGTWQVVWKLNPDNTLQPVRVKTGLTDFTFTAMQAGDLKPGDKLVIAQTGGSRANQQPPGGGMRMRF